MIADVASPPAGVEVIASDAEAVAAAAAYARSIAPGAIARDAGGGAPHAELVELARTGLLAMRVPPEHGGAGVAWRRSPRSSG